MAEVLPEYRARALISSRNSSYWRSLRFGTIRRMASCLYDFRHWRVVAFDPDASYSNVIFYPPSLESLIG